MAPAGWVASFMGGVERFRGLSPEPGKRRWCRWRCSWAVSNGSAACLPDRGSAGGVGGVVHGWCRTVPRPVSRTGEAPVVSMVPVVSVASFMTLGLHESGGRLRWDSPRRSASGRPCTSSGSIPTADSERPSALRLLRRGSRPVGQRHGRRDDKRIFRPEGAHGMFRSAHSSMSRRRCGWRGLPPVLAERSRADVPRTASGGPPRDRPARSWSSGRVVAGTMS